MSLAARKLGTGTSVGIGAVLTLVVLMVLQSATSVGPFGIRTETSTETNSTTSSYTTTSTITFPSALSPLAEAQNCLLPVDSNSTVGPSSINNTLGALVNYGDGAQSFFPQNSCPQPVSDKLYHVSIPGSYYKVLTNDSELAIAAVTNPEFLKLENGQTYFYAQPGSNGFASATQVDEGPVNGTTSLIYPFFFFLYGNETLFCLGPAGYQVAAGIEVDFVSPETGASTSWNLAHPMISMMSSAGIDEQNGCSY